MTPTFHRCVYRDCLNSYGSLPNLSFHRFPKNETSLDWIIRSGNDNLLDLSQEKLREKRICSAHFDEKYYIPVPNGKRRLAHHALPNLTWVNEDTSDDDRNKKNDKLPKIVSTVNAKNDDPSNSKSNLELEAEGIAEFEPNIEGDKNEIDIKNDNVNILKRKRRKITSADKCLQVNPNDFADDDAEMGDLSAANLNSAEENPKDLSVLQIPSTNFRHTLPENNKNNNYVLDIDNNIDRDHCYYQTEMSQIKLSNPLAKRVIKLTTELEKSRKLIDKLKKKPKTRMVTGESVLKDARYFLNKHQLMLLNMQLKQATKTNPHWTTSEQCFAISLYAMSPRAYKFLKNKKQLGLPSEDFIKEWATKLNITSEKMAEMTT